MTVSEIEKKIGSSIGVFWLLVSIISGLLGVYAGVQYEAGQAAYIVTGKQIGRASCRERVLRLV